MNYGLFMQKFVICILRVDKYNNIVPECFYVLADAGDDSEAGYNNSFLHGNDVLTCGKGTKISYICIAVQVSIQDFRDYVAKSSDTLFRAFHSAHRNHVLLQQGR